MKIQPISFRKRLRASIIGFSAVLISLLNMSLAFSRTEPKSGVSLHPSISTSPLNSLYDSLQLDVLGLSRQAFDYAKKGWERLTADGQIPDRSVMTIVDFSQPSSSKRLFVLDMEHSRVIYNTLVAHGKNSGLERAESFSNTLSSLKSSLGFYRTGEPYMGGNGYSLKLYGLEKGVNDRASDRAIVLHGADYVSQNFINQRGFLGRSYGCPAVPAEEATPIINTIKGGSCLFIYSPNQKYLTHSPFLNS